MENEKIFLLKRIFVIFVVVAITILLSTDIGLKVANSTSYFLNITNHTINEILMKLSISDSSNVTKPFKSFIRVLDRDVLYF